MSTQWVRGNQNVQIRDVTGSSIQIIYKGQQCEVPLEPAVVPVGKRVKSPSRLIRARSGVVPYVARDLLGDLENWTGSEDAFAGYLIGGRGGTGKTRLGGGVVRSFSDGELVVWILVPSGRPGFP
jgi:hypothetical protein